jgi:putative transposase
MAGESELLKLRRATGRPGVIPQEVIAGISTKISEETCEFKSYKEIAKWVEYNYQVAVKYQTLHKQLHYRMKTKLKVPRRVSNKKDDLAAIELKKTRKIAASTLVVGVCHPQKSKKWSLVLVSR